MRQSPATFIDGHGSMQLVPPRVLRPDFQKGACVGALLEPRAFNLIANSRFWNDFSQSREAGDASTSWVVDYAVPGLFDIDSVMKVTGSPGARVVGPSIDVASAGSIVCGSFWILLVAGSTLTEVELVLTDLNQVGSSVYFAADMTLSGQWQRLSVSLHTQAAAGRNLRIGLLLSSPSGAGATVLTQCWQVEPGGTPTSYIPTSGTLGIRAQDDVLVLDHTAASIVFTVADVLDAVASTIPAATIAWTAISPTYVVG